MSERTLEEIEALAAMCTFGQWAYFRHDCKELAHIESFEVTFGDKYGTAWIQSGGGDHPNDLGKSEAEANAALMANAPRLLAIAQEQRAVLQEAKAAMRDMLCGWKMIRNSGGEDKIYGIGWDRAQAKVEAALDKIP